MIIKPFERRAERDPRLAAGHRAEAQMAHYLDRTFKTRPDLLVLHDVRVSFEGDNAQIDHLVVHPFGVAIVESKSVTTAVRINVAGEWERSWKGRWSGMPDPLLQGQRQGILLKNLLKSREPDLLDRKAFGLMQGTFTHMAIDVFAAISDEGTIRRARRDQATNALKADAVPDAIVRTVDRHRKDASLFNPDLATFWNAPRDFNRTEMLRVAHFLRVHSGLRSGDAAPADIPSAPGPRAAATDVEPAQPIDLPRSAGARLHHRCKHCGSEEVEPRIGKYGPYGRCRACGKNTSVRPHCPACGGAVQVERAPDGFRGRCETCSAELEVVVGPAPEQGTRR